MINFSSGANSFDTSTLDGRTVREVLANAILREQLSLRGDETVRVRDAYGDLRTLSAGDTVKDGDEVMFERSGGTKGN